MSNNHISHVIPAATEFQLQLRPSESESPSRCSRIEVHNEGREDAGCRAQLHQVRVKVSWTKIILPTLR